MTLGFHHKYFFRIIFIGAAWPHFPGVWEYNEPVGGNLVNWSIQCYLITNKNYNSQHIGQAQPMELTWIMYPSLLHECKLPRKKLNKFGIDWRKRQKHIYDLRNQTRKVSQVFEHLNFSRHAQNWGQTVDLIIKWTKIIYLYVLEYRN